MSPEVDLYFLEGCGRCPLGGTPECRVHQWEEALHLLRLTILDSGLTETLKWKHPCYTYGNSNLILLGAFKEYCMISFIKGALLKDEANVLELPGENSHAGRVIRFTNVEKVIALAPTIKDFIAQSIENEKQGLKIAQKQVSDYDIPIEFEQKMQEYPPLRVAFESLTPGRQKGYLIYFSQPKQAKTREARVEKYMQQILDGKGFYD